MSERGQGEEGGEAMGYTTRGAAWEWRQSWFLAFFLTGFLYWVPLVYMGLRVLDFRWVIYGLFYGLPGLALMLVLGKGGADAGTLKSMWQAAGAFYVFAAVHTHRARGEYLLTVSEQQYDREELRQRERLRTRKSGGTDVAGSSVEPARLLNVNRLGEMELAMLPGLGPEGAQRALKLRAELGDFLSFADFASKMQLTQETRYRLEHLFEPDSGAVALAVAKDDPAYRNMPDGSRVLELNWASAETLGKLPGLGQELAQRAVALRESDGPFKSLEDFRYRLGLPMDVLVKVTPFVSVISMSSGPAGARKTGGRIVDV